MDYSPPGSSVHGILQEEYWSGLPFPSPNKKTTVGEIIITEENGGLEEK